jgi:hypothetical protein
MPTQMATSCTPVEGQVTAGWIHEPSTQVIATFASYTT